MARRKEYWELKTVTEWPGDIPNKINSMRKNNQIQIISVHNKHESNSLVVLVEEKPFLYNSVKNIPEIKVPTFEEFEKNPIIYKEKNSE